MAGPTDPAINFRPFANSSVAAVTPNTATQVQLDGASGYPDSSTPSTLTYSLLSQPTHGKITNFNPSTGTLDVHARPRLQRARLDSVSGDGDRTGGDTRDHRQ